MSDGDLAGFIRYFSANGFLVALRAYSDLVVAGTCGDRSVGAWEYGQVPKCTLNRGEELCHDYAPDFGVGDLQVRDLATGDLLVGDR